MRRRSWIVAAPDRAARYQASTAPRRALTTTTATRIDLRNTAGVIIVRTLLNTVSMNAWIAARFDIVWVRLRGMRCFY